jgi:hypothetical protein
MEAIEAALIREVKFCSEHQSDWEDVEHFMHLAFDVLHASGADAFVCVTLRLACGCRGSMRRDVRK